MSEARRPVIVIEDDAFIRIVQIVLDPACPPERHAAYADFMQHDLPDFDGWLQKVREASPGLYPADVRIVYSQEELHAALPEADAAIIESFEFGADELAVAPKLAVLQKFGSVTREIDIAACESRGVEFRTLRRRANASCAEHTLAHMLVLARKLNVLGGRISFEQLREAGYDPKIFDRSQTASSGWARVSGLRVLYESTLGIIGLGEIGQELALRAAAFGMQTLYYQRRRLSEDDERRFNARYVSLDELLAQSDWVSIQLPGNPSTRGFIDAARLAQMKPGAFLINTSRPEIVDRQAVIDALKSGHLGGFGLDTLYELPGRPDDELLSFDNVFLTPWTAAQPRFNALSDLTEMITGLAHALAPKLRPNMTR
jgi:phosphoglycerate dehydrogenase-like enzyme